MQSRLTAAPTNSMQLGTQALLRILRGTTAALSMSFLTSLCTEPHYGCLQKDWLLCLKLESSAEKVLGVTAAGLQLCYGCPAHE